MTFFAGVVATVVVLALWVRWQTEWKYGFAKWKDRRLSWRPRWWNRWSPWVLRSRLADLHQWLHDERAYHPDDRTNTDYEQNYRYVGLVLEGHPFPRHESGRYSVRGGTLHIDATGPDLPPFAATLPRSDAHPEASPSAAQASDSDGSAGVR